MAVADAIDNVVSAALRPRSGFEQALAQGVEGALGEALVAVLQATRGLRQRSELLWWKEALYSPLRKSGLPLVAAGRGGGPHGHRSPRPSPPRSVPRAWSSSYARRSASSSGPDGVPSGTKPLKKLAGELATNAAPSVRTALAPFRQTSGRGPLVALLADLFEGGRVSPERFIAGTGVTGETKLSLPDLAVWIFRELQAAAAVAAEPPATAATGGR